MNDELCIRMERALEQLEKSINPAAVYTADEAAKRMCCNKVQIYAYIRCGKLQAFHLDRNGQKWLVTGKDLENLIDTLKRENS